MGNLGSHLLLSICIPTRGRSEILLNTLASIYSTSCDDSHFEVVIYDSSEDNYLEVLLQKFNYSNLVYKRGENSGFMNLINALEMGRGAFLKLHNDYSVFNSKSLEHILKLIEFNIENKPQLFFPNGSCKVSQPEFLTFDDFLYTVSYFSSWSTAFGVWRIDFEGLRNIAIDPMFPHTSLLFALADKPFYVVDNKVLFKNAIITNKGGYDLFKTFGVDYLTLVKQCLNNNHITNKTFKRLKADMLVNFFAPWYAETRILKNEYTFVRSDISRHMSIYYSNIDIRYMVSRAYLIASKNICRKGLKMLLSSFSKQDA